MKLFSISLIVYFMACSPTLATRALAAGGASTGGDEGVGAINVTVFGKQMSPDWEFNSKVMNLAMTSLFRITDAHGVVPGAAVRYVLKSVGDEGGESFCLEVSKGQFTPAYERLRSAFEALGAELPDNTSYDVTPRDNC